MGWNMGPGRDRVKAWELFSRVDEEGAYSNVLVAKGRELYDNKEKSESKSKCNVTDKVKPAGKTGEEAKINWDVVQTIVFGTLEKKLLLDYYIDKFLKKDPKKKGKEIRNILRLGIYQLIFMNTGSDYGICNDMVAITKMHFRGFEGLVNGVLRNVARSRSELIPPQGDDLKSMSIRYSIGEDIINLWIRSYGLEKTRELAENSCRRAPLFLRVNLRKKSKNEAVRKLISEGVFCHPLADDVSTRAIVVDKGYEGRVVSSDSFKEGDVSIQDLASIVAIDKLDIRSNDKVLDMCSAPGGKGVSAGELASCSNVICWDLFENKISLIENYAKRCGIENLKAVHHSALDFQEEFKNAFDKVILDPPCSGLGVMRRRPEIRYKSVDYADLSKQQFVMLTLAARYVKPEGSVLYSTCTVNPQENQDIIEKFLEDEAGKNFEKSYERQVFTGECGADGFYICVLKRRV